MTKARIKTTGRTVDVISRFMPKKRNAPSRDWVCNLSDGTCINESEIEYLNDPIQNDPIQEKLNKKALEYANKHYSEWEEHWYDYNGYNTEPENDKLELIDAFITGAEWAFRQGWTFDAHKGAFGICFDGNIDNLLDSLKDKEVVTVQIRKK